MGKTKKGNLKRFLPYLKKYRWIIVLDLFCALLTSLCDLVLPLILRTITDKATTDIASLTIELVVKLSLIYVVLRLIDGVAQYCMADIGHIMGVHIETNMRTDAFEHLQKLSHNYYSSAKIGTIMGRITNDLFEVTEFSHHCPEEFFIAGLKIVVSFAILCKYNIYLTLLIFLCVPIMAVVSYILNHRLREAFRQQRVEIGELNSRIEDSLLGQSVVKAFSAEDVESAKFEKNNKRFEEIKKKTYHFMALFQASTRLFDGLMYLVVIAGGGIFVIKGLISPGDLVAYVLYVSTLIATIRRIVEFAEQFQRGMTGIERFFEIIDSPVEIFDAEGAVDIDVKDGSIEFNNVSFVYPDDGTEVLDKVNIKVAPGERVALVGTSGGGKTTLCNLIPRFYDLTSGEILIDGQNIQNVTLKSLRKNVGIVEQDVYMFSGTVFENIAYGKENATLEEVREAARLAGADAFIEKLQNGYDTYVGERGVKLSGGQKQRISIARVFLKNPPILILDEATSALDNESEILVSASLERLAENRTTVTIAHRLTTIRDYDRIIVLGKNGIEEEGNHEELLKNNGTYYRLWNKIPSDEMMERLTSHQKTVAE